MSKSTFQRYHTDIIIPNTHRINSLRVSNIFMCDLTFSLIRETVNFPRLRTLIINNIEYAGFANLVQQLTLLHFLSSLAVTFVENVTRICAIYSQIFRLSALKYCKVTLEVRYYNELIPCTGNQCSAIEHLIMNHDIYDDGLDSILSYVPQLLRLSFRSKHLPWKQKTKTYPTVLNQLTHVSVNLKDFDFVQVELMITHLSHSIQVLCLSTHNSTYVEYMNANRWKQLILSTIPNLRIFDIQFDYVLGITNDELTLEGQINQFSSSFWTERQWFFEHRYYRSRCGRCIFFYSTNPYR